MSADRRMSKHKNRQENDKNLILLYGYEVVKQGHVDKAAQG